MITINHLGSRALRTAKNSRRGFRCGDWYQAFSRSVVLILWATASMERCSICSSHVGSHHCDCCDHLGSTDLLHVHHGCIPDVRPVAIQLA
jgi:hypothetical protein